MTWLEAVHEADMMGVTIHRSTWLPADGITFGHHIFLKVQDPALLMHELVHVRQQEAGRVWFWIRYVFFPLPIFWSWRWKLEAEAYKESMKYDPAMTAEWCAEVLSSGMYFWPVRYETALKYMKGLS